MNETNKRKFPSWPQFGEEEKAALMDVYDQNRLAFSNAKDWQTKGTARISLEEEFARFHDCKFGIAVTSGTAALMVALRAVGVEKGDEVIVQSYMCIADTEAIIQAGAVPVFCDIDPANCGLNLESVEACITAKTKAIIAIHFGGYMIDMDRLSAIAEKHNVKIVEDASLATGSVWNGRKVGSSSLITIFSFGTDKLLTVGEGGIVITNDAALADKCQSLRNSGNYARIDDSLAENRALAEFTDIEQIGWNFRMPEAPAALGLVGLHKLPLQIQKRHENGRYLDQKLSAIEGLQPLVCSESQTLQSQGLYIFKINEKLFGCDKESFIKRMNAEGIPALYGYHNPIYKYSVFRKENAYKHIFHKYAEAACSQCVWFSHSILLGSKDDMDAIAAAARKIKCEIGGCK